MLRTGGVGSVCCSCGVEEARLVGRFAEWREGGLAKGVVRFGW